MKRAPSEPRPAAAIGATAPTPRGPFGIGVIAGAGDGIVPWDDGTGHTADRAASAAIATALDALCNAAPPGATFRLITTLANRVDGLAVDAAIARGWTLDVVLPVQRDDEAAERHPSSDHDVFGARLAQARSVLELPDGAGAGSAAAHSASVARVVLTQCDLLLAIGGGGGDGDGDGDGDPNGSGGGSTPIVAEAVAEGVPVLLVDRTASAAPMLLWSGLHDHDFGLETVATIARGGSADLPRLFATLIAEREPVVGEGGGLGRLVRPILASAYPLLLAITGVHGLRRSTPLAEAAPPPFGGGSSDERSAFAQRIGDTLDPRFVRANAEAQRIAQLFRSAYVTNFSLAAIAVLLSLIGLALPAEVKPILVTAEFLAIATILIVTRIGGRSRWQARWLDSRQYAERLRCLAISAWFGDLTLRLGGAARDVARTLALPSLRVDAAFLRDGKAALLHLLDDQIGYLTREATRMHRLEHRLHRVGGLLFAATATLCLLFLMIESGGMLMPELLGEPSHRLLVAGTIFSAALPAVGAAIYGIRMQGDFAGVAERNTELAGQLRLLRKIAGDDEADFDMLRRLARRATDLMTLDVSQWQHAYRARPLALPG